jgi:hypothetical protein
MHQLAQGQRWLIDIARILDAPLPVRSGSKQSRGSRAKQVQRRLNRYLANLQKCSDLPDWLLAFRRHLVEITHRWGDDLFVCYDIAGVPPTNNALESRFGRLRRDQRRISGRQFNTATLLDEGPYLVWECGTSEAQVLARLRRVAMDQVDYKHRYQKLRSEQSHQQLIYRLQHHRQKVFHELEREWFEIHSHKTL